jgi:hypothetical protein
MGKQFRSFAFYYRRFFAEFIGHLWQSWRAEVWPAVVVAILVFILSYRHDPNAKMAFIYTGEACFVYLAAWGIYHLVRTPWKLNEHPPVFKEPGKPASSLSTDLRGDILELYFHPENDLLGLPSRTYILMKVQIVNRGIAEATITKVGLQVRVGQFESMCDLLKEVPETWQIRRRDDRYLNMAYKNTPLDKVLGSESSEEIYRPGIPRSGYIAFELYAMENIQFPNAEFTLFLEDSLGGQHRILRMPQLYIKTGEIIAVPPSAGELNQP